MTKEKIAYGLIQEIARDVTEGYSPKELPSLEEISWAFPVEGPKRVHYVREGYMDRIPNSQEGNVMKQIMTFRNFKNVLQYLEKGKTVQGIIPSHVFPCGNADDGAYMVYPYIKQRDTEQGEKRIHHGFFWETMPSGLVKAVLKVERTGRGKLVDANGEEIEKLGNNAYVDENLTREYLQNLKEAYELGSEHMHSIVQSGDKKENYDQLAVDANPGNWQKGQEFQKGFYSDGKPALISGKVLSNDGKILKVNVWDFGHQDEGAIWEEEIEELKKFGEHGLLWKLVPAKK